MISRRALVAHIALLAAACGGGAPDPAPTAATAEPIRGALVLEREGHETSVLGPTRVEVGATARTAAGARGAIRLDTGAWTLLDHESELRVDLDQAHLEAGRLFVDATDAEETTIDAAPYGSVSASGATFAVERDGAGVTIYATSGEITYRSEGGSDRIRQGEKVRLAGSAEPEVEPAQLWDDWTGGLADPTRPRTRGLSHLGVLAGRRVDQRGEARVPLPIRSHDVAVELRGDLARTVVTQTFFNARSENLEGEWTVRLPEGAIVESFAVDRGFGSLEAARPTALGVGSGYGLAWMGPERSEARLSYDGPDRLRARVHPIGPGATLRVQLVYTEWLERTGDRRTYVYPMRSEGQPPLVGEFSLTVQPQERPHALSAGMGAVVEGDRVVLRRSDFRPRADFYLDLFDQRAPSAEEVKTYLVAAPPGDRAGGPPAEGQEHYVLFDIPTESLAEGEAEAHPLELAIVVDVSGDTDPEDLELARALVEAILRQLAPSDRVALRVMDVHARVPELPDGSSAAAGLLEASEANREAVLESLARVSIGGATDLGVSLREAAELVAGRPRGALLYLGDGLPTTGALDATRIRAQLANLDDPPRFFGFALGEGANLTLLERIFDGQAEAVEDRSDAARAVMRVLAEAARPTLRGVRVDAGEGVERLYPRPPMWARDGRHLRVVGRLIGELPESMVVRGRRDGVAFERTLRVRRGLVEDAGDIRRRWATARLRELIDRSEGREALVDLGLRFALVSPWTSLELGGVQGGSYQPTLGFDHDPFATPFALGGGGASLPADLEHEGGWRRRVERERPTPFSAPEMTWSSRVEGAGSASAAAPSGDGGLARAAAQRALSEGERGPRGCFERRALMRPDLAGDMTVEVEVDSSGEARRVRVVSSSVGDDDVARCVETEISGLRFPESEGAGTVTVRHQLVFEMSERELGRRRTCSEASNLALDRRQALWRERLAADSSVPNALRVYREAQAGCELGHWRARRALLHLMLRQVGGIHAQIALYRALRSNDAVASYLRRAILRRVRTPEEVIAARQGLGIDVPLDWSVFARAWRLDTDPNRRLRLVRRWLAVAPKDIDLRLRLLALLEETGELGEARRLARELSRDPLADTRVRTAVGELWLRLDDETEARRVFSELVERSPLDPWARRRLGDLYRAHGWADDAYREYRTLSRLVPSDGTPILLLARAAADAGRIDEALRLEQALSERSEAGDLQGVAGDARLWTMVRLARLSESSEVDTDDVRRRQREAGALRDPPALFVALVWSHPDDDLELRWRDAVADPRDGFVAAELGSIEHGVLALAIRDREPGDTFLEIRRPDQDRVREARGELIAIADLGGADQRITRLELGLSREDRRARVRLGADGTLEIVRVPAGE